MKIKAMLLSVLVLLVCVSCSVMEPDIQNSSFGYEEEVFSFEFDNSAELEETYDFGYEEEPFFFESGNSAESEETYDFGYVSPEEQVDLYSIADYFGWPVDVFSAEYFPVDGSEIYYQFFTRPDGTVALKGEKTSAPSNQHQYPLRDTDIYLRDDNIAFLHFEEDYGASFAPNGILTFGGREYWPRWLTENEQANRSELNDIVGGTVKVAFVDQGYYRVGNGTYAEQNSLFYIPNGESPVLIADEEVSSGFCVLDGWIYMNEGKTDATGYYVPYQQNGVFEWKEVVFLGMTSNNLYFVDMIEGRIYETDTSGDNARKVFDLGYDGRGFDFASMNESTICCIYNRKLSATDRESSFVLLDLANGTHQFVTNVPYRIFGDWAETSTIYAEWAGVYGDCVLFFTNETNGYVKKLDLNTMQYFDVVPEYELPVCEDGYVYTPECARVGDWLYHPYCGDKTMLVRSRMDGSIVSEYVATMEEEIEKVYFIDGRLILRISDFMMSNKYVEIGY